MASSNHTLPSPNISDVMILLSTMKKQNEAILAKNEKILTKLNAIEDDNRKLRQELLEIKKSSHALSKKRNEPEDEKEKYQNVPSIVKKPRVSAASLANINVPDHVPDTFDPPASFDTLDDDCLGTVLEFVGKKCYSAFGRVNKRCHEMFCSKGLPKVTYVFGYAPLHIIQQQQDTWDYSDIPKGVLHYNRRDIFEWILADESDEGYSRLDWLCDDAIIESRLDILREVFDRANTQQLEYLRAPNVCHAAATHGKLECLEFLRENECEWDEETWIWTRYEGHEHILEYLRNNGYPTEWQVDSDSEDYD